MRKSTSSGSTSRKQPHKQELSLTPKQIEELKLMLVGKMEVVGQEDASEDYARAISDEISYMLVDLREAIRAFDEAHPAYALLHEIERELKEIKISLKNCSEEEDQSACIQKINELYHPVELLTQHGKKA
jgi:hypothetical protein